MLVQGEIVINRPVDEVFDFVAGERWTGMKKVIEAHSQGSR